MRKKQRLPRVILSMLLVPVVLAGIYFLASIFVNGDYNYARGVLALNTDKSGYVAGEPVLLQMASLDKNGDTLCDSPLELRIQEPGSWWKRTLIGTDQIQRSPTCDPTNNVTNEPDYIARFVPSAPGTYKLVLRNADSGKTVKASFVVTDQSPQLSISRSSATRINPFKSDRYPMVVSVTAGSDFSGTLTEKVPKDFTFAWIGAAAVGEDGSSQTLTWQVDLKAGETKEFAYEYDAPQLSPGFIRLSGAQLKSTDGNTSVSEMRYWQIASDAPSGEGMFLHAANGSYQEAPHYREWTTTDLDAEADMEPFSHTTTIEDVNFTIIESASTRHEYIRGTLSEYGHLDIQIYDGSTWTDATGSSPTINDGELTTGIGADNARFRGFDIAYEDSTGDALVVYEDSTTGDGTLKYRTWDGSVWSSEGSLDYTAVDESADVAVWVELQSDVGSDNILAAWHDKANDTIVGAVWDGSAWQDITQMTASGLAETHGQTFDAAWEATSGEGMIAYGTGTTTAYRVYTASAFAAAGASPPNPGEAVNWLSLAGDVDSDYIALIINSSASGTDVGSADTLVDIFNGTDWTTVTGPADDTDTNSHGLSKGSDVMWEPTGDRALFVFRDGTTSETVVRYVLYDISANQWQAIEDGTHCALTEGGVGTIEVVTSLITAEDAAGPCTHATAFAGNVSGIAMAANPANSQIMVVASNESALGLRPELLRWNGDANGTWLTQTATMGAPETDNSPGTLPLVTTHRPRAYDFAFRDSGADSTGVYVYDEDGANDVAPRYRVWSGTDLGSEASLNDNEALAGADEPLHTIVKAGSTRDEYVAGMLTASGDLVVQVWNGSSWSHGTGAPTDGVFTSGIGIINAAFRGFDIAYEDSTGDALVLYEDTTTANGTLKYRTWNGSTWSGESTLTYTSVDESNDVAVWVELKHDPGSDNILAAWHDKANETIIGARWDGSAWQHLTQLSTAGVSEANGQTFDLAWEATSGDGMVVYATGTTTAYRTYTTGSGFSAAGASPVNPGEAVNWLSLAGDWDTDYIAIQIISGNSTSTSDALVDIWNGSNWTTIAGPTDDSDINFNGYAKGGDVAWEATGDRALFVYRDGTTSETLLRYVLYDISANQWQAIDDGTNCLLTEGGVGTVEVVTSLISAEDAGGPCTHATAFSGTVSGISLEVNPLNSQIMVTGANETVLPIRPELLLWNGDANGSWLTQTGTMGAPEPNAAMGDLPIQGWPVRAYDFAFNVFTGAAAITISGTIYQSDETTAYDCSAVTAVTVHSSTNGAANQSADCTAAGGTYSIATAVDPGAADIPIVVYIDTGEATKATTVTLSSAGASNITNLDLFIDRVIVTRESSTSITNAHLATADNGDAGIRYAVSGGNVTIESPLELHVRTTETYAPGGNVTTDKMHVEGTYTGASETLTLLGSGTGTSRPLYVDGGTFTAPATTIFQGTSATDIESTTFNALSFTPTITGAVTYTLLGAETINGNFTINPTAGTTQLLTVNARGTITVGAAYTTTLSGTTSGTSTLDLRPSSTDYNLSTGLLNIATAGTLDATGAASTITLTGTSGTLFTRSGSFTAGSSTVVFNPDAAVTLTSGTFQSGNAFYNVSLTPSISSSGRTYTFGAGAITIGGDPTIQPTGTQLLTVNMAGDIAVTDTVLITRSSSATSSLATGASNPALSAGDISVATGGTLNGTSSSSIITLTENGTPLAISGTFTPGSTTVAYVPASTSGVNVASTTYFNVIFNRASNTFSLQASGITATNDLTITAGTLDTVSGQNYPIAVGRNWTNTPGTGGFLAQNGTVTFNTTTAAVVSGATNFYSFTATTAPKAIDFADGTTFRIDGVLTLTGSAGPNYITLDSVTGGSTAWTINHQGTESISYASVKNSSCDGTSTDISADNGTNNDAGNNGDCWIFSGLLASEAAVWKFDEGYGTTANDTTGNTVNGTLAGVDLPIWQSEDMCISGKCLYFEGTSAVVTVANPVDVKTISFWVRPTSTTTTLLQLADSDYISASGGTLAATGFTGTFYVNGVQTNTIVANRWQHIVVTSSSTVDGTEIVLGNNSSNYFTGFMDEVKFITDEYDAGQVKAEFTKRGSVDGVSAQFGDAHTGQLLSDGLVGYWKLDEGIGSSTTADTSGNGITAAMTSMESSDWLAGKFGQSLDFDGSAEYLTMGDPSGGQADFGTGSFTVAAWVWRDTATTVDRIITKRQNGDGSTCSAASYAGYSLVIWDTDEVSMSLCDGTNGINFFTSPGLITTGNWNHIVAVVDRSDQISQKIYINGVEQSVTTLGIMPTDSISNTYSLNIGTQNNMTNTGNWDGRIDEARTYNRALSPLEVTQLYQSSPGPIGHWKLDENTATTAYDVSSNLNNGTLTGGPTWSPGKLGQAVRFDGSNDYITIPDSPSLVFGNGTTDMAMSVSAWVKQDTTAPFDTNGFVVASKTNDTLPSLEWLVDISDNQPGFTIYDNVGNSRATRYATTAYPFAANTWYHIAATYDGTGSGGAKIFINGVEVPTSLDTDYSGGTYVAMHDTSGGVHIGGFAPADGTYNYFGEGYIDDFRIYNYKRTPAQVIVDMNGGHPLGGSPVGSATAYWKFDEVSGTTAYDNSVNANNLTLSSASWTSAGKFGAAWNGTGSVWLSRADDADFDLESAESFSISLWFRSDNDSNPGADQFLFDKQVNGNAAGYRLYVNTSGFIVCDVDDDTSSYPEDSVTTTIDYYDASWHHVVCMRDSENTDLLLYIDGQLRASDTTLSATGSLANTALLYVGDDDGDATNSFAGDIDEVRFYRAALTEGQVKTEFNANKAIVLGKTGTTSTGISDSSQARAYCVPGDSSTCAAPVVEYHFEVLGLDSSGNNNNNELTPPDQVTGIVGKAADFEEASGDVLRVDDNSTLDIGGSFSISTWINPETLPASATVRTITGKTGDGDSEAAGTQTNWFFVLDNNIAGAGHGIVCSFEDSAHADYLVGAPRVTLSTGVWTHVACVFDDANNEGRIYVNGRLVSTATVTATPATNNHHFYLGISNEINQFSIENEFDGIMDEFRLYNYARSSSQIAWDMNRGEPLIWYKMDECTGSTINNSGSVGSAINGSLVIGGSGSNTSTGTCSSGTSTEAWNNGTTGKVNASIDMDGNDDYISVADSATTSFTGPFSMTAWFYRESTGTADGIFGKYNSDASRRSYLLGINSNVISYILSPNGSSATTLNGTTSIASGRWYHVAGVYDGSTMRIYLDGKLEASTAYTGAVYDSVDNLNIGNGDEFWWPFDGKIDDARIFSYPLTQQQVRDAYNNGAVQFN